MAALCVPVGVPDSTRVFASKLTPAGGVPAKLYVNGAFPPLAAGSVILTATLLTQVWSLGAVSDGMPSSSTVIVNSSLALVPVGILPPCTCRSVAVCVDFGVPDSTRVPALKVTPVRQVSRQGVR